MPATSHFKDKNGIEWVQKTEYEDMEKENEKRRMTICRLEGELSGYQVDRRKAEAKINDLQEFNDQQAKLIQDKDEEIRVLEKKFNDTLRDYSDMRKELMRERERAKELEEKIELDLKPELEDKLERMEILRKLNGEWKKQFKKIKKIIVEAPVSSYPGLTRTLKKLQGIMADMNTIDI